MYRSREHSVTFVAEQITPKFCGSGIRELGSSGPQSLAARDLINFQTQRLGWTTGFAFKVVPSPGWSAECWMPWGGAQLLAMCTVFTGLLKYPHDVGAGFPQSQPVGQDSSYRVDLVWNLYMVSPTIFYWSHRSVLTQ